MGNIKMKKEKETIKVEKKDLDAEYFHIGVVGTNATAKALEYAFSAKPRNKVCLVDDINNHIEDLLDFEPNITFFCTEVNWDNEGLCEASKLEDGVLQVTAKTNSGVVIRTPLPIEQIERLCKNEKTVYAPELVYDSDDIALRLNIGNMVLGGNHRSTMAVQEIFYRFSTFNIASVSHMSVVEAAFVEQMTCSGLVMKSMFYNQFHDVVAEFGGDYHLIAQVLAKDPRLGTFGGRVPNIRGERGYSNQQAKNGLKSLVRFNERFTILKECDTMNDRYQERD